MGGILQVDTIQNNNTSTLITQTNATTITFGTSGQTITIPSGTTFNASSASVNLPSINLATGVTGTLPIANGGTGAATLAGAGLANTPVACYSLTSNQSVTNATWTTITGWTAILASANFSSNTFTIPSNGNYKITLIVRAGSSSAYNYYHSGARIGINGSTYYYGFGLEANASSPYPNYDSAVVSVILNLSSGNTITFDGYSQIASGTPSFFSSYTLFNIVKLIG